MKNNLTSTYFYLITGFFFLKEIMQGGHQEIEDKRQKLTSCRNAVGKDLSNEQPSIIGIQVLIGRTVSKPREEAWLKNVAKPIKIAYISVFC